MSYRCLICHEILDSPHKIEVHLKIEHKWNQKKEAPRGRHLDLKILKREM